MKPKVELEHVFEKYCTNQNSVLTMECPRCSVTLSDRYRSFPSPVSSIRNPGSACINSDNSWKDRNCALSSTPAAVPASRGKIKKAKNTKAPH